MKQHPSQFSTGCGHWGPGSGSQKVTAVLYVIVVCSLGLEVVGSHELASRGNKLEGIAKRRATSA